MRLVNTLIETGGLRRGHEATRALSVFLEGQAGKSGDDKQTSVDPHQAVLGVKPRNDRGAANYNLRHKIKTPLP